MCYQLYIGLSGEGATDTRFFSDLVRRIFLNKSLECYQDIEITVICLDYDKIGMSFNEETLQAYKKGVDDYGIMLLCQHADADSNTMNHTYTHKIQPARINLSTNGYPKEILVPIVPIQEMESWMLADKELLKQQIGTLLTDSELLIHRKPEFTTRPKEVIENAIRIARSSETKKRRNNLKIEDLYEPIGKMIELSKLKKLSSYKKFEKEIEDAFRYLGLL